MSLYLYFVRESPVKIWGLTPRERIERILSDTAETVHDLSALGHNDHVLIFRADYLLDDRLVKYLATTPDIILYPDKGRENGALAAHVPADMAQEVLQVLEGKNSKTLTGLNEQTLETISVSFNQKLRKFEPPFVFHVDRRKKDDLEQRLFDWSYKGVTDLVTKWVWPRPAQWAVRQCMRHNIRPNYVTMTGLLLVIAACFLFAYGHFGLGLLAGWIMTFLDTVDGKLARVTVTSSKFGHYFDHIIDIVHPPIYYILWGIGLEATGQYHIGLSLGPVLWLIFLGYVAGRLVEGMFQWFLGKFGIFCWRPIDSFFRLITARRNPNMILLTLFWVLGRPDWGLLAVSCWTVITTLFLILRLAYAFYLRMRGTVLHSWFTDIDRSGHNNSLAMRWFTRDIAG